MVFVKGRRLGCERFEHAAEAVDLFAQVVLPLAGGFQFLLDASRRSLLDVGVSICCFE